MLDALSEWVIDVVESLGYLGVALLVALENVFPPIPSEVVLGLAGFVASRGDALLVGMIVAATAGSLVGAWVLYAAAAAFGRDRLRGIILRNERWLRVTERDMDRAEGWFDHHSNTAVLVCRCIPLVRSLISLPAGFQRMPLAPFTLYTAIGSLAWNSIFVTGGYLLGERWETMAEYADYLQYLVLATIAAGVAYFVWRRFLARDAGDDASRADRRP